MSPAEVLYLGKTTVLIILYLSLPTILSATAVGLLVALMQTLIQLQEQTLSFAIKLITVIVVFFITGGWMSNQLLTFIDNIFTKIGTP